MRTIKAALHVSIAHAFLSLVVAATLAIAAINTGGTVGVEVTLAIGAMIAVAPWPGLAVLAAFPGRPVSHGIGLPASRDETRTIHWASLATVLLILLYAAVVALQGAVWIRTLLTLVAVGLALAASIRVGRILATIGHQRDARRQAIAEFAPELILYTGRPEGGAYQIQQWLPQLLELTPKVMIVVRHLAAFEQLSSLLPDDVAIVCCRENKELDEVMVPSVRTAFYVNSVTSNSNLVSFRNVNHVYLGHGDSDKEISAHPVHRMYDAIFVAGQAAIDRYAMQDVGLEARQAHIVGRPQLEGVLPESNPIGPVRAVLYCPTWTGYNQASSLSSLSYARPFIEDLLARGIRIIFRPHPFSRKRMPDAGYVATIDALLAADPGNHVDSRSGANASLIDLFNESDALVTDVSSVLIDYLASKKRVAVLICAASTAAVADGSASHPTEDPWTAYPSTRHAYLPESTTSNAWNQFFGEDPLRETRERAATYYLGTTSTTAFRKAVLSLDAPANPPS
ncbi:CDP-glycerol glycerophosphotransferase family protein [Arthrobacter rhombi]|uniref:CDP-glycerol glycerophosphotransferase family protein n=1 Tax=Arthrobacter rhombi TaxID=71253 RepID=UPI003FD3952D